MADSCFRKKLVAALDWFTHLPCHPFDLWSEKSGGSPVAYTKENKGASVHLIRPRLGGLANDMLIQTEEKITLYHVRSKPFSPLGRSYVIYDGSQQEVFRTQQENTAIFPRHAVFDAERAIARVGQSHIVPLTYFVQLGLQPRAEIHVGGLDPVYRLVGERGVLAEVAQHRATWIVVTPTDEDRHLILLALAIIYRENTIGG